MAGTHDEPTVEPGGTISGELDFAPCLILVLEGDRPLAGSRRLGLDGIDLVQIGRGDSRGASRTRGRLDVRVPSRFMSEEHARLLRVGSAWAVEDMGSRNGCFVNGKQVSRAVLSAADLLEVGRTFFRVTYAPRAPKSSVADFDGHSVEAPPTFVPHFAARLSALATVARSPVAVLILGESGTGKEVLARRGHDASGRRGDFVAVNCGALPAGLAESLLFGHTRGAFSGALRDEPGFVRAAEGGTLFLDEVADLPKTAQIALLRALQERVVVPVGAVRPVRVDFALIAATHRPLDRMVTAGEFRHDLLARLSGFVVDIPPLRERRDDLGVLIASLLRRIAGDSAAHVSFSPEVARALLAHDWPRNIRELEQCLAVSVALAGQGQVQMEHLPAAIQSAATRSSAPRQAEEEDRHDRLRLELLAQLARHEGNVADVARAMGKARMQVHRWCKRYGIDPNTFRPGSQPDGEATSAETMKLRR